MNNPLIKLLKSKIYTAIFLLAILLGAGVVGFKILSQLSWIDAFYMTVITITTVGFGEVQPLDESSKVFTILLILTSVVIVGYAISVITEYILSKNNFEGLKQRKMQKKIDNLKDHIIICGYGRNGKQAVTKLKKFNMPCVVIEKDKELIEELEHSNILFIEGDATDDEAIKKASLENAKSLITALPSDADNLFVVLSARQINSKFIIISRASNESSYNKLKIAGATNIIMPDKIGGDHMASLVVTPDIVEFVDRLTISDDDSANLEELSINDLPSDLMGKTILDLDLRRRTGCTVIGFKTSEDEYIVNPEPNTILNPNSHLIVLGRPNQIEKLREIL